MEKALDLLDLGAPFSKRITMSTGKTNNLLYYLAVANVRRGSLTA